MAPMIPTPWRLLPHDYDRMAAPAANVARAYAVATSLSQGLTFSSAVNAQRGLTPDSAADADSLEPSRFSQRLTQ